MSRAKLSSEARTAREAGRRAVVQAQRRAMEKEITRNKRAAGLMYLWSGNARAEDVEARLAEIPPDTRGLTARTFGDPLPGRSALDRIRGTTP